MSRKNKVLSLLLVLCLSVTVLGTTATAKTKEVVITDSQSVGIIMRGLYLVTPSYNTPIVKGGVYVPTTKKFENMIKEVSRHYDSVLVIKYKKKKANYYGNKYKYTLVSYKFRNGDD